MKTDALAPEYRTIQGKRMVLLPEAEFEELIRKADLWEPALPAADADGNRPADEYAAVRRPGPSSAPAAGWACRRPSWPAAPASARKPSTASSRAGTSPACRPSPRSTAP